MSCCEDSDCGYTVNDNFTTQHGHRWQWRCVIKSRWCCHVICQPHYPNAYTSTLRGEAVFSYALDPYLAPATTTTTSQTTLVTCPSFWRLFTAMSLINDIIANPAFHDYLAILKGARNGFVYGVKVRFPHALVMSILFGRGEWVQILVWSYIILTSPS